MTINGEAAISSSKGRSLVSGAQRGWLSAAPLCFHVFSSELRGTRRRSGDARGGGEGNWKSQRDARSRAVMVPQGPHAVPQRGHLGVREEPASLAGVPESWAVPVPPPGRRSAAAAPGFFPGKSTAVPKSPAAVTPLPAVPPLPWETLPASLDFTVLPDLRHPRDSRTVPSPRGAAAGAFPLSHSPRFAFRSTQLCWGPAPFLHSPDASRSARHTGDARCCRPAWPTGRRPASPGRGGARLCLALPPAGSVPGKWRYLFPPPCPQLCRS